MNIIIRISTPVRFFVFGTFRNPKGFEIETGFYNGASAQIGEMLIFKDVTIPKETGDIPEKSLRHGKNGLKRPGTE